jgi:hypothetical protein
VPLGGSPIWGGHQHGDSLGAALSPDQERRAELDWRLLTRRRSRDGIVIGWWKGAGGRISPSRAGGRTRRACPEGRLSVDSVQAEKLSPKMTLIAVPSDRPTSPVAGRNWPRTGSGSKSRLVFIDETWTTPYGAAEGLCTNAQSQGAARLLADHDPSCPHAHDRITSPLVIDARMKPFKLRREGSTSKVCKTHLWISSSSAILL